MAKKAAQPKTLKITLIKSGIGYPVRQKATLKALGLRKINQTVIHQENEALLGMVTKVIHLVKVEEES